MSKMSKREAGRLGGRATVEKYGRRHMSEIGARGFAMYALRHHNNNYEAAAFALQKAKEGRFEAFPCRSWDRSAVDVPGVRVNCGNCQREIKQCNCPVPF
jgi:hypothetical protein